MEVAAGGCVSARAKRRAERDALYAVLDLTRRIAGWCVCPGHPPPQSGTRVRSCTRTGPRAQEDPRSPSCPTPGYIVATAVTGRVPSRDQSCRPSRSHCAWAVVNGSAALPSTEHCLHQGGRDGWPVSSRCRDDGCHREKQCEPAHRRIVSARLYVWEDPANQPTAGMEGEGAREEEDCRAEDVQDHLSGSCVLPIIVVTTAQNDLPLNRLARGPCGLPSSSLPRLPHLGAPTKARATSLNPTGWQGDRLPEGSPVDCPVNVRPLNAAPHRPPRMQRPLSDRTRASQAGRARSTRSPS